jgi:hypothetical protein
MGWVVSEKNGAFMRRTAVCTYRSCRKVNKKIQKHARQFRTYPGGDTAAVTVPAQHLGWKRIRFRPRLDRNGRRTTTAAKDIICIVNIFLMFFFFLVLARCVS